MNLIQSWILLFLINFNNIIFVLYSFFIKNNRSLRLDYFFLKVHNRHIST